MSNNFERLSSVSSVCCFCSFLSSFGLCACRFGGSIAHTYCSSSISSVVVRSSSITYTSLNFSPSDWAGTMLIGTDTLSSVSATMSRLMFLGVLDSPQSIAIMTVACSLLLFVGPVKVATQPLIGFLFHYPNCPYFSDSLELFFFVAAEFL